jgi:hypothetical protein
MVIPKGMSNKKSPRERPLAGFCLAPEGFADSKIQVIL